MTYLLSHMIKVILRLKRGSSGLPRPGYIFLLSVLVIGAIAIGTSASLVLLGISAEQSGLAVQSAAQAWNNGQTCVEKALLSLRGDSGYAGDESFTLTNGSCALQGIAGAGNTNRTICAEGSSGRSVRKLQVTVSQILPTTRIATWKEVTAFTLCP